MKTLYLIPLVAVFIVSYAAVWADGSTALRLWETAAVTIIPAYIGMYFWAFK